MAFHWSDNIYSNTFTPRDYQVELLAAAMEENIVACLSHNATKEFLTLKLVQEYGFRCRSQKQPMLAVYLSNNSSIFTLLTNLTDLSVFIIESYDDMETMRALSDYSAVIISTSLFLQAIIQCQICLNEINLLIVDEAHRIYGTDDIHQIFRQHYPKASRKPRVVCFAGPLHSASCPPGCIQMELEYMERLFDARIEAASDVTSVLRYCAKPKELILECAPMLDSDLTRYLKQIVQSQINFLKGHRYEPAAFYDDQELIEELKNVPDPTIEPLKHLNDFLHILHEMGPWCADRAALSLISTIEKQKLNTPYERHFLLLSMVSTLLVQLRAIVHANFDEIPTENERIELHSSPKIKRLLELFRLFYRENAILQTKSSIVASAKDLKELAFCQEQPCLVLLSNICVDKLADFSKTTLQIGKILSGLVQAIVAVKSKLNQLTTVEKSIRKMDGVISPSPGSKFHRQRKKNGSLHRRNLLHNMKNDVESLCGLIFCENKLTTQMLYCLICTMSKYDPELTYITAQNTLHKSIICPTDNSSEAELEHRKQEEVLKRFRMHECNLLIGTSILEEGIDLPKCNLVIRWDDPPSYRSYVQCKGRARASSAYHIIFVSPKLDHSNTNSLSNRVEADYHSYNCNVLHTSDCEASPSNVGKVDNNLVHSQEKLFQMMESCTNEMIEKMAVYSEIEKLLLSKCKNSEPHEDEQAHADLFTHYLEKYYPTANNNGSSNAPYVDLSNAVQMFNKYCAKLPSDTFTKLTPLWRCLKTVREEKVFYQYTIRLPINSPWKEDIVGLPMPTKVLARRLAAYIGCRVLHAVGELDNALQPIGKETFRALEEDWENFELEKKDAQIMEKNLEPRPGTTKRRQYYYKRISSVFSDCRPEVGSITYLYQIKMNLTCPIPEEQNTRGRKIYPPEESRQGFGILTTKRIPNISAFPIFTRSGEVKVMLDLCPGQLVLSESQLAKINAFINFTFTKVLRLQKCLMLYDTNAVENCFFVVPTCATNELDVEVDWKFIEKISANVDQMPKFLSDTERCNYQFDAESFKDAVVMPWYRNQDQPQYFYVAEICRQLSPKSEFPGFNYRTFEEYYLKKYNIQIQNVNQPLLDVDHTSARLNFLTPRYVNRKGVALPTSSEETKRAKRENLEQKQILVPELCAIHPFSASLWRAAVCLPCILYRLNALLVADEIRKEVARDLGLGKEQINENEFQWPMLSFGWNLADVLKKSKEGKGSEAVPGNATVANKIDSDVVKTEINEKEASPDVENGTHRTEDDVLEIGTWSNDMADSVETVNYSDQPHTDDMFDCMNDSENDNSNTPNKIVHYYSDSEISYDSDEEYDGRSIENDDVECGLKIEFKSENVAEAVESDTEARDRKIRQSVLDKANYKEKLYQSTKNLYGGFNCAATGELLPNSLVKMQEEAFEIAKNRTKAKIRSTLIKYNENICSTLLFTFSPNYDEQNYTIYDFVPFAGKHNVDKLLNGRHPRTLTLLDLYALNEPFWPEDYITVSGCSTFDRFSDNIDTNRTTNHQMLLQEAYTVDCKTMLQCKTKEFSMIDKTSDKGFQQLNRTIPSFSFDLQPNLVNHSGPSPSVILQALTMSNANDGINLERLETIGDSFLKYAITTYLYCTYENVHEGKLSHLRSKQVSNLNLYRLGRKKCLGECMIATKFEPHDNWLPPCYYVPKELEQALVDANIPARYWNLADLPDIKQLSSAEICQLLKKRAEDLGLQYNEMSEEMSTQTSTDELESSKMQCADYFSCYIPYNLVTQHSIPDKSIADCVEALIGSYLIDCGPRGALLLMAWLGIRVLPVYEQICDNNTAPSPRIPGSSTSFKAEDRFIQWIYGEWIQPKSPLLLHASNSLNMELDILNAFDAFEEILSYEFSDRSYLVQALTHASYSPNRWTDCYQRLEFLGDAVLDYLITRHLYEDPRQHSPGALTDLRSALVNNTIFATLAVRHSFHKYFLHLSPGLSEVIDRFVSIQLQNGHRISEECYLITDDVYDEAEDVEVPKALGDVFESVAGAIFLDSGMSLDAVWRVYSKIMGPEIEQFSSSVPKSPIRELLELEPETAKFSKPEKLTDGRRVRVTVEVFGKGTFRGIGRNYRIAKCTAAKCALKRLKEMDIAKKKL